MRILLVEDEPRVSHFVSKGLRESSYAVDLVEDGETALYRVEINIYDLIILDVMLPGKDGFEVCREARKGGVKTPVLMLTARDSIEDRVNGLDCGADDYLVKPFDFRELLARVRALLRREKELRPSILQVADLILNTVSQTVTRAERRIVLTAKEYALLEYFALHSGRLLRREEIAEHVWDDRSASMSNIIDVYVRRLRKKIDDTAKHPLLHTRRGVGYLLSDEEEEADAD
jgi:two-component system, OmpR family, copper resistance phosphate regulon response regulator CusR